MTRTTSLALRTLAPLALALLAGAAFAGPLTPAAGPVAGTMKTLADVEPRTAINAANTPGNSAAVFRITQSGSYYLTENMTVGSGLSGISISASDVTIDLNGFTIKGQAGSSTGVGGSGVQRVTVRNGQIVSMGGSGVGLTGSGSTPYGNRVENMVVRSCGSIGIQIQSGSIRNCQADQNASIGIFVTGTSDSIVENCTANGNDASGINVVGTGTVTGSSASANAEAGISLGLGTVSRCTAADNATGFIVYGGTIVDSNAVDNTTVGITINGDCVARGNSVSASTIRQNTIGIQVQNTNGARIEGNQVIRMTAGINCLTPNNLVIGNSLRGCTNAFNVLANNRIGTIVSGTASPAIIGNTGGGLGTTDPLANIIY